MKIRISKCYLFVRYAADGNRREGQWIDDQLHGFVTFTCRSCNNNNTLWTRYNRELPKVRESAAAVEAVKTRVELAPARVLSLIHI